MLRLHVKIDHPQPRHIARAAEILRGGGVGVYPTDLTYGLGCDVYNQRAISRVYQLKGMDRQHPLAFLCCDLSQVARYAVVEDRNYRILRHHTPGPFTFILPATREVPKVVQSNKRTVGVRIPESNVCIALIRELGHPIVSTTVNPAGAGSEEHLNDPDEIASGMGRSLEVLLDGGPLYGDPSSVIDLTGPDPVILRRGAGDLSWLGDE